MKSEADDHGHFGECGGRYVPETLIAALEELDKCYRSVKKSSEFWNELDDLLGSYAGRPTPLYFAENLSDLVG